MRLRMFAPTLMLCLAAPALLRAAPPAADKPAVVVTIKSLDGLLADARHVAELCGKGDEFKQAEGGLKGAAGPNGLDGLDTKKPAGFYVRFDGEDVEKTEAVALIPVTDEKAVLAQLEAHKVKAEKGDDGVYEVTVPGMAAPAYLTFADGYAYVSSPTKAALAADRRLAPGSVLPADSSALVSAVLHIDRVPDKFKELVLNAFEQGVDQATKDAPADEPELQKQARKVAAEGIHTVAKMVVKEGGDLALGINIDRRTGELSASVSLGGAPGGKLSGMIADLGAHKSVGASLIGPDSAMNMMADVTVPESLRKYLLGAFDDGFNKALDQQTDETKKKAALAFRKAIGPTLESGELDGAMDFRGPNADGLFTILMGMRVKDGAAVEKFIRDSVTTGADKEKVTLDFDKAGDVAIHKIVGDPKDIDANFRKLVGDKPVMYFAFRDDAVLLAVGEDGLAVLKKAVAAKPKPGAVLQVGLAMGRFSRIMAATQPGASEAAKQVFKEKNKDKLRIALEGGASLKAHITLDAQVLAFFYEVGQGGPPQKQEGTDK